jgi:alpha-beta hydrolase superfamily lysophospholipase
MASTSSTEHLRFPDDTILVIRRFQGPGARCVVVLPDFGHTVDEYEKLCVTLSRDATVHLLELRGHGLSEGSWSHVKQRSDVEHFLAFLRKSYSHIAVVAHGFSASIMLEREATADRPDAMVLVAPVFIATAAFFKMHRRVHEHPGPFHLPPVRVRTPAVLLLPPQSDISALHHVSGALMRKCGDGIERIAAIRDSLRALERETAIRARQSRAPISILQ